MVFSEKLNRTIIDNIAVGNILLVFIVDKNNDLIKKRQH